MLKPVGVAAGAYNASPVQQLCHWLMHDSIRSGMMPAAILKGFSQHITSRIAMLNNAVVGHAANLSVVL